MNGALRLFALALAALLPPHKPAYMPVPFAVGERAEYDVSFLFSSGTAVMEVGTIDTVRGFSAYRFMSTIRISALGVEFKDSLRSWTDTATFRSLRFYQDNKTAGTPHIRRYEVYPERTTYTDRGLPEQPSVPDPLDDASFLYFVRTLAFQPAPAEYTFARYFRPESNPVTLRVLRRETVRVPYGVFVTTVIQPIIKTKGMFSKDGHALVWIADDAAHTIVQIQTKLSFGTITMKLKSLRASSMAPTLSRRQ